MKWHHCYIWNTTCDNLSTSHIQQLMTLFRNFRPPSRMKLIRYRTIQSEATCISRCKVKKKYVCVTRNNDSKNSNFLVVLVSFSSNYPTSIKSYVSLIFAASDSAEWKEVVWGAGCEFERFITKKKIKKKWLLFLKRLTMKI